MAIFTPAIKSRARWAIFDYICRPAITLMENMSDLCEGLSSRLNQAAGDVHAAALAFASATAREDREPEPVINITVTIGDMLKRSGLTGTR